MKNRNVIKFKGTKAVPAVTYKMRCGFLGKNVENVMSNA